MYAAINFIWDDETKKLTVSNRENSFPGMLKERVFHIVKVSADNGKGQKIATNADRVLNNSGMETMVEW